MFRLFDPSNSLEGWVALWYYLYMKLYNTLTKKVEELAVTAGEPVRMYTCGPTVYNYAHIGNFRSYIFADSIYRALKYTGHTVDWVMNLTDVDDKTIRDTLKEFGTEATVADLRKFTDKYIDIFLAGLAQVNIDANNIRIIRVADVIPQIQEFVLQLMEKGYAYQTDDGVFFSIEKYQTDFGDYGELVGQSFLEGKKVGARVKVDEYEKENLSDFALWKKHTPEDANIYWEHPTLGKGRPGWHIECSVINDIAFNHRPTDIHTGGVDLIFPHHTNEIAQSQPFYKPFTKYWAHCEHLQVDNKRMAKRDGNFYTLKDLSDKDRLYPMAFRYLSLQTDFRKTSNFTFESLDAARTALERLYKHADALQIHNRTNKSDKTDTTNIQEGVLSGKIREVIQDDLNFPKTLALMWEALSNNELSDSDKSALLVEIDDILGLGITNRQHINDVPIPEEIKNLATLRDEARANKDFANSDELRRQLEELGYEVLDTKDGTHVKRK